MNFHCTDSIVLISFKIHGFQTTEQYSKLDLTYTMKAAMSDARYSSTQNSKGLDLLIC